MEELEEKKRQEMQMKKQRREEKARRVAEKKAALNMAEVYALQPCNVIQGLKLDISLIRLRKQDL